MKNVIEILNCLCDFTSAGAPVCLVSVRLINSVSDKNTICSLGVQIGLAKRNALANCLFLSKCRHKPQMQVK